MVRPMTERRSAENGDSTEREADFGFLRVPAAEKASRVRAVFESVADRYDLMNDLMSGGLHRLWKRAMIERLAPRPGMRLLDVAGGTGDIAFRFLRRIDGRGWAVVCDASPAMLARGRDRALDRGLLDGIDWIAGDAESLPIRDGAMDACTIAFGLRNVTHIDRALAEARRVLRPGGRFLCLEFSHVAVPLLAEAYDFYSFRVIPEIGRLVAGDRDAYQYLVESIRRFPTQKELARRMADAGLEQIKVRNLSGGIVAIHSGWRL